MFFVWTGWGILAPIFYAVGALGVGSLGQFLGAPQVGVFIGVLLASVAVWHIGRRLNRPEPGYHPKTGQTVTYKNQHTLFYLPMQYFAFLGVPFALYVGWVSIAS